MDFISRLIADLVEGQVAFSDVHVVANEALRFRTAQGLVVAVEEPVAEGDIHDFLANHAGREDFDRRMDQGGGQHDFALTLVGTRFRCHLYRYGGERGSALAMRRLDSHVPRLDTLGLPEGLPRLLERRAGLILFTGPTGSGKTTSLAGCIDHLNRTHCWKIVTIEDPIEYRHASRRSLVVQRELGSDVDTFALALAASFREDPDCIVIGEIRDRDTMAAALAAAEGGHLVLATLHTAGAVKSIERVIDFFPAEDKVIVRSALSSVLEAIVSQALLPRLDGQGRVLAVEMIVNYPAIASLIRDGKAHQIGNAATTSGSGDMLLLNRSLAVMVRNGTVTREAALRASYDPRDLERELEREQDGRELARGGR